MSSQRKPNAFANFISQFTPTSNSTRFEEAAAAWEQLTDEEKQLYKSPSNQEQLRPKPKSRSRSKAYVVVIHANSDEINNPFDPKNFQVLASFWRKRKAKRFAAEYIKEHDPMHNGKPIVFKIYIS